jgi:hypothetical protein
MLAITTRNAARIICCLVFLAALSTAAHAGTATFSRIEEMSGWQSCTGCAGGGGNAIYWMKQGVSSPSLDGKSAQFFVGGTTPFSHGLWWRRMSSDSTATRFTLDMYYYMPNPGASQGLEFAANQASGGKWYKFSTQCSFAGSRWRVWDTLNSKWVDTGIACTRPPAYTWQHVTFEYARTGGQAKFLSITVNGKTFYVNKGFSPKSLSGSGSVGVHFQLDGNRTQDDYTVWMDKMSLKYW